LKLEVTNVCKDYPTPSGSLTVLSDISFTLQSGDATAFTGPSGTGKSTLLYILGGLETPSKGSVTLGDKNVFGMSPAELAKFRGAEIGFVFQDHCLLPQCSVIEPSSGRDGLARGRLVAIGGAKLSAERPACASAALPGCRRHIGHALSIDGSDSHGYDRRDLNYVVAAATNDRVESNFLILLHIEKHDVASRFGFRGPESPQDVVLNEVKCADQERAKAQREHHCACLVARAIEVCHTLADDVRPTCTQSFPRGPRQERGADGESKNGNPPGVVASKTAYRMIRLKA